jgi:hypothetical protein
MPEFLQQAIGDSHLTGQSFFDLLVRMAAAFVLATLVAFRPWRRFLGKPPARVETAQAQVLIAVAATIVVSAIGDNLARAFGLVGLGGFVRFRSPIKDPRDAAVMFLLIGVGMACAVGVVAIAAIATVFILVVLIVFDATASARAPRQRVAFVTLEPAALLPEVVAAFPGSRVLAAPQQEGGAPTAAPVKLILEMDVPDDVDAATIAAKLRERGVRALRDVVISED